MLIMHVMHVMQIKLIYIYNCVYIYMYIDDLEYACGVDVCGVDDVTDL
jgi:hypothetical protein